MTEFTEEILEKTTKIYTATILDENDVGIPLASLNVIELTFYDLASGEIINSRDGQDVKNANNVVIDATGGGLAWEMQPDDSPITNTSKAREKHKALFEWTYDTAKKGKHEVVFVVRNLNKVP